MGAMALSSHGLRAIYILFGCTAKAYILTQSVSYTNNNFSHCLYYRSEGRKTDYPSALATLASIDQRHQLLFATHGTYSSQAGQRRWPYSLSSKAVVASFSFKPSPPNKNRLI